MFFVKKCVRWKILFTTLWCILWFRTICSTHFKTGKHEDMQLHSLHFLWRWVNLFYISFMLYLLTITLKSPNLWDFPSIISCKALGNLSGNKVQCWTTKASGVSERVLRARNAVTVTQRACLLMERRNGFKAEQQRGAKVNRDNRRKNWKWNAEHFISDDTHVCGRCLWSCGPNCD